jgi:hypothetical protein
MSDAPSRKDSPMTRRTEDDDDTADGAKVDNDAEVVPEAGEGAYPPIVGEPKPPIGN